MTIEPEGVVGGPVRLSARNRRVLRLRRLARDAGVRRAEGAFLVEGPKLLQAALDAGSPVESVYVTPAGAHPVVARAAAAGVPVFEIAPAVLARVADAVTPQPLLAVVRRVEMPIERVVGVAGDVLVLVCIDIRDAGNLGAVLRSAEAGGAGGIICCAGTVDVHNPKCVRASAGAVFRLPVATGGQPGEVLETLGRSGVCRLGAQAAGGVASDACDLTGPTAIVLGNEGHGLPAGLDRQLDGLVTIPMAGAVESLNVGVAAAVLCFDAARQRRARAPSVPASTTARSAGPDHPS